MNKFASFWLSVIKSPFSFVFNFRFEKAFNICDFKLTAVILWKSDIAVYNIHVFLKYAFIFLLIRSMQERDPLKQAGFFIKCSKLKESAKSCKFLSSEVIFKSPNIITFSCVSKYMARLLDKLSKNTDLICSGNLHLLWAILSRPDTLTFPGILRHKETFDTVLVFMHYLKHFYQENMPLLSTFSLIWLILNSFSNNQCLNKTLIKGDIKVGLSRLRKFLPN